jgi:hypothetical protein
VRYQTALHSDISIVSGGGLIATREEHCKRGTCRLAGLTAKQNAVASLWSGDYVDRGFEGGFEDLGASPSGKAAVFGTAIPRFESWRPSQIS